MSTNRISQSLYLRIAVCFFATNFVGFGINAMLRPIAALAFFELQTQAAAADKTLLDSLSIVYGVRDIFVGVAIFATAYFGERRALGWILVAASGVALVDGWVCWAKVGKGEWNHFGYAPVVLGVGCVVLGILDGA